MKSISARADAGRRDRKPRLLFFAEHATLAHVARPLALLDCLDSQVFDLYLAADPRVRHLLLRKDVTFIPITSMPSETFLDNLRRLKPVFPKHLLLDYVVEDLRVLEQVQPDAVIGDLRLSLSVSARKTGTPYVNITNAHWSPESTFPPIVPESLLTKCFGVRIGQFLLDRTWAIGSASHAAPLNSVRKSFGLPALPSQVNRVYTDADYVLYSDLPELVPVKVLAEHEAYIGPVQWSYPVPRPSWWDQLPPDKPTVFVALGSSGNYRRFEKMLAVLAEAPITLMVSTGKQELTLSQPNIFTAEYLPGNLACQRSDLVITNGGSPTSYQAMAAGKPVICIASNMDQHLFSRAVSLFGAGVYLRSDTWTAEGLTAAVEKVLQDDAYITQASKIGSSCAVYDYRRLFGEFIDRLMSTQGWETHKARTAG